MLLWVSVLLCASFTDKVSAQKTNKEQIDVVLNNWHKAAADADAKKYFGAMTDDAVFIGTDATENWNKKSF